MVKQGVTESRSEAVELGNELLTFGIIEHVNKESSFEDKYLFYRFTVISFLYIFFLFLNIYFILFYFYFIIFKYLLNYFFIFHFFSFLLFVKHLLIF